MRVLIVDDSAFMRKVISEMISQDPLFEIVATARDGEDGVKKALEHRPELITLDIEMPKMNGLDALREIRAKCRDFNPAVLMCSSLTLAGSHETLKALRLGASDFIAKDPAIVGLSDKGFREELIGKLRVLGEHRVDPAADDHAGDKSTTHRNQDDHWEDKIDLDRVKCVVIGSSTGGPPVLEDIFSRIPGGLGIPIIVAQHMPPIFTKSLASRLDQMCACKVRQAQNGTLISEPGISVLLGGVHTTATKVAGRKVVARQVESLPGAVYRPSVDRLFESASEIWGEGLLAIQLTGMGADGAKGTKVIRERGGQVIAQAGETCAVYGMPKAVVEAGTASAVLTPTQIRDVLSKLRCGSQETAAGQNPPKPEFRRGA